MNQKHQEQRVRDQRTVEGYLYSEWDVLPQHGHHHASWRCNRESQTRLEGIRRHKNGSRVEPALPAVFYQISPEEIATRQCTILCLLKISVRPLFCKAGGSAVRILVKVKNFCEEFPNKT